MDHIQCSHWTWSRRFRAPSQVKRDPKEVEARPEAHSQSRQSRYKAKGAQQWHSRSSWKRSFGRATRGAQWLHRGQWWGKSPVLAWSLSAVPARVRQTQQINPLPPTLLGIEQNNAAPVNLAAVVTVWWMCDAQHSKIMFDGAHWPCRKSAYDCS